MFKFFKKGKDGVKAVKQNANDVMVEVDGEQVSVQTLLNAKSGSESESSIELQDKFVDSDGVEHSMSDLIDSYRKNGKKKNEDEDNADDDEKENAEDEDKENEAEMDEDSERPAKKKSSKKNKMKCNEDEEKENADGEDDEKENAEAQPKVKKNMKHFAKLNNARTMEMPAEHIGGIDLMPDKLARGRSFYGSAPKA